MAQSPYGSEPVAVAGSDATVVEGTLVTLSGAGSFDPESQPITYAWSFVSRPAGSGAVLIGKDGTISIQPIGQGPETYSIVDRIKLVNPDVALLQKGSDGLLRMADEEISAPDANVSIMSGALEQSNVNVAKTLVNMIELARQYEMQVNVIKESEENADAAAQMMSLG